jgi:rhodanese-related sulfurtransferase
VSGRDLKDGAVEAPEAIFARASGRAHKMRLSYAGAITPAEAYRLREAGVATIVDVRTRPEWELVGHVADTPLIEWPRNGERLALAAFLDELRAGFDPTQSLLFICRSGVRSHYAAQLAAHAGYGCAYNVLEGFEGEDGAGNGWRNAGLPWEQG